MNGMVTLKSTHSVADTVARMEQVLRARGIKLFVTIDHSGEAEKAGLEMPNTKLLIFGNPKTGTPLMLAYPSLALDLPLKILVWEDATGGVWATYSTTDFLQERHGVPSELAGVLRGAEAIAKEIVAG